MKVLFSALALLSFPVFAATPTVTSVTAQQRYPWNGQVDISYRITGDVEAFAREHGCVASLKVVATDVSGGVSYVASALSGDTSLKEGMHYCLWDFDAQGVAIRSTNVIFTVSCETNAARYCVVDLSGGVNAAEFPVSYLLDEPDGGFNSNQYKTTKIVLKMLDAGTFIMGEDRTNEAHRVVISKPFYMGLFEVTQRQWQQVMGSLPNNVTSVYGVNDREAVYYVSYGAIRGNIEGTKWPQSSSVDETSFLGVLRSKTHLALDLPTEAQWEYACRAGTTTKYSCGKTANGAYMYCSAGSSTAHADVVGMRLPNPWGLYDMHGNVWEWCLDWGGGDLSFGTDPVGPEYSGTYPERVVRGGDWNSHESFATSSYRTSHMWGNGYSTGGFRLSCGCP